MIEALISGRTPMRWSWKSFPILKRFAMPIGARGEKLARRFLKRLGYRIIKSNYGCPTGEIDIVAADGEVLVFVEVKSRRSDEQGDIEESVNWHKQKQVTKAARYFIQQQNAHNVPARFDVVTVVIPAKGKPTFTHFIDAFEPTPR